MKNFPVCVDGTEVISGSDSHANPRLAGLHWLFCLEPTLLHDWEVALLLFNRMISYDEAVARVPGEDLAAYVTFLDRGGSL